MRTCKQQCVPYPLHRPPRWPAVAKPPAGIAPRRLFPKVHPQEVEAILRIDNASLVFIDSHPQPHQELPQLRHVHLRGLPSAQHHEVSSPGEFHPEALSEPYLNLSAHTAPAMEPRRTPICQCAHNFGSRLEIRATQCVASATSPVWFRAPTRAGCGGALPKSILLRHPNRLSLKRRKASP